MEGVRLDGNPIEDSKTHKYESVFSRSRKESIVSKDESSCWPVGQQGLLKRVLNLQIWLTLRVAQLSDEPTAVSSLSFDHV